MFSRVIKTACLIAACNISCSFNPVIISHVHLRPSIKPLTNRPQQPRTSHRITCTLPCSSSSSLYPLGNDLLIFLFSTIAIVPMFKWLKASPVLGFLAAGLLMGPAGLHLFSDLTDMESLAEFGILFLLFEQGLELNVERLKSLWKYAFGMGTAQVLLSTVAFFAFPFMGGVPFLEYVVGADASVVDITRIDEAAIIGAALSLSSSAFVLKILQEKNQLSSTVGRASLGILLMQDIAVVPLLVLLPIVESNTGVSLSLVAQAGVVGATVLKAVAGLGGIVIVGGAIVRGVFSVVAKSQSSETFVALCLLVALGIGALTDSLGLSSTLGAFVAGTLLAESNYRTQVETDIQPFKGLLLGLFFLTTGASVDPYVIQQQWPTVFALLAGLITFKTAILTFLGPKFGLSLADSVRTGLLLSGGGEFAFVVLTLADKLGVLPDLLAKMLVGVVVLSMALTPYLSQLGDTLAEIIRKYEKSNMSPQFAETLSRAAPELLNRQDDGGTVDNRINPPSQPPTAAVVICGFEAVGESLVHSLQSQSGVNCVAFDLDPGLVTAGRSNGHTVYYGDGSQPLVLHTAGIYAPNSFVITFGDVERMMKAVERLRQAFPSARILARCGSKSEELLLRKAGADFLVCDETAAAGALTAALLSPQTARQLDTDRVTSVVDAVPTSEREPQLSQPLLSFTSRLRDAYDASRVQLDSIVSSVVSLGQDYVWLSDSDLSQLASEPRPPTESSASVNLRPVGEVIALSQALEDPVEGVTVCTLKPLPTIPTPHRVSENNSSFQ